MRRNVRCSAAVAVGAVGAASLGDLPAGSEPGGTASERVSPVASWTHFAGGATRRSVERMGAGGPGLPGLSTPAWVVDEDHLGRPIVFLTPGGVVCDEARAYVVGTIAFGDHLIAVDRVSGEVAWATPVPDALWDSWSTPCVDLRNGTVLVASGNRLTAVRSATGAVAWQATLNHPVVNASAVVTSDLAGRNRAFITDAPLTSSAQGKLYCVNVDPFDPVHNPHAPGAVVWAVPLGGLTSGNSPAYADGRVYVASAGPGPLLRGEVRAFDARAASAPEPLWTFTNTIAAGFFGGVGLSGGSVFASSYAFSGNQLSANTVRLDAATGALQWSAPSNRTDATPVLAAGGGPGGGGLVLVSSGLPNEGSLASFGSFPTVQALDAATGALVWDLALDTWTDLDQDGAMDPGEYLSAGGWSHQPIAAYSGGGPRLVVGSMPGGSSVVLGPYEALWVIDLAWNPASEPQPPILDVFQGAGSTPALDGGWIYTVGPDGLHAFGP